jgi:hypothetical protein
MSKHDLLAYRLVPDDMWDLVEKLMPPVKVRPQGGGRSRVDARPVFVAIVWVLSSGASWRQLPRCFGVSTPTAYRYFRELTEAHVWRELRKQAGHDLDWCVWARGVADAAELRAWVPVRLSGTKTSESGAKSSSMARRA